MPAYIFASQKLTEEERRNLLLRSRLGQQMQSSKYYDLEQDILRVDGRAMVHSPRITHPYEQVHVAATGQRIRLADKRKLIPKRTCRNPTCLQRCTGDAKIQNTEDLTTQGVDVYQKFPGGDKTNEGEHHKIALHDGTSTLNIHFHHNTGVTVENCDRGENLTLNLQKKNTDLPPDDERTKVKLHSSSSSRNRKTWSNTEAARPTPATQRRSLGDVRESQEKKNSSKIYRRKSVIPRLGSSPQLMYVAEDNRTTSRKSSKPQLNRRRSSKNIDASKRNQNKESVKEAKSQRGENGKDVEEDVEEEKEKKIIRKFSQMPNSKPKNVCFDYPGVDVTYLDVKHAIERVIPGAFENNKVVSVRFENINVKLGTRHKNNRWHIELSDIPSRNRLIKFGLTLNIFVPAPPNDNEPSSKLKNDVSMGIIQRRVDIELYDAVMMEEYKLFLRSNESEEKLQSAILLCAGRSHGLLSTLL